MKKLILKTICAALLCFTLVMLYMHRKLIIAAIKGEELPKAPMNKEGAQHAFLSNLQIL